VTEDRPFDPVVIIVLLGSSLAGLAGALIALPVTAALKVVIREVRSDTGPGDPMGTEPLPAQLLDPTHHRAGQPEPDRVGPGGAIATPSSPNSRNRPTHLEAVCRLTLAA
jgi:hypothetical protein